MQRIRIFYNEPRGSRAVGSAAARLTDANEHYKKFKSPIQSLLKGSLFEDVSQGAALRSVQL